MAFSWGRDRAIGRAAPPLRFCSRGLPAPSATQDVWASVVVYVPRGGGTGSERPSPIGLELRRLAAGASDVVAIDEHFVSVVVARLDRWRAIDSIMTSDLVRRNLVGSNRT